ncbi:MAG: hypothetical protein IMZ50_04785 [Candidatus Atribacteria bacterium]|nr:hypothetical protein [Candidatus Atribacteria bacterium]
MLTGLGVLLAIIGIVLTIKANKKIKLSYIEVDYIPLFQSIVKNIDGIEVQYEGKTISPSLHLLKGCIINAGTLDIDDQTIHEPLRIKLSETFKWIKVGISDKSPDLKLEYEIRATGELEFRWNLMKKGEYIKFDALIEAQARSAETEIKDSPKAELGFTKNLSFLHRITNLDAITFFRAQGYKATKKFSSTLLFILMFAALFGISIIISSKNISYILELPDSSFEVELIPLKNDMIELKGVGKSFSKRIETSKLFIEYKLTPKITKVYMFSTFKYIMFAPLMLAMVLMSLYYDVRMIKKGKLFKAAKI